MKMTITQMSTRKCIHYPDLKRPIPSNKPSFDSYSTKRNRLHRTRTRLSREREQTSYQVRAFILYTTKLILPTNGLGDPAYSSHETSLTNLYIAYRSCGARAPLAPEGGRARPARQPPAVPPAWEPRLRGGGSGQDFRSLDRVRPQQGTPGA